MKTQLIVTTKYICHVRGAHEVGLVRYSVKIYFTLQSEDVEGCFVGDSFAEFRWRSVLC